MTVIIAAIIHEAAAAQTCRSLLYTTLNQRVLGSSPSAPTNLFNGLGGLPATAETAVSPICHRSATGSRSGRPMS